MPLSNIRVLDFSWIVAGPYASRLLADFGAEVIKVQCKKTATGVEDNLTAYFNNWNRNKLSITLDLSYQKARDIILELTKLSDVVLENFSPRVMTNWGLSFEHLSKVKPDLIMVSMSAMGQTGPWKDYVAYGHTLHALSGLTLLTSMDKADPVGIGYAYSDFVSGLYGALGVLAALERRSKTGEGQYIDLSQYEALCSMLGPFLMAASTSEQEIQPHGNCSGSKPAAPYGCYRCKGGDCWCVLAIYSEDEWQSFAALMDTPGLSSDLNFNSMENRQRNKMDLDMLVSQWTAQYAAEDVVKILQEAGISAGVVQNAQDLARDTQLIINNFFQKLNHPVLGETVCEQSPIRLSGNTSNDWRAAPLLGEHNRYVFSKLLGLTEKEIGTYSREGIIG